MKRWLRIFLAAQLLGLSGNLRAESESERPRFTLVPFGGYRINGSVHLDDPNYSRVDLPDDAIFGVAAGVEVPEGLLEIMWTHQDSAATVVPSNTSTPAEHFDLNTDQFHFNGLYYPPGFDHLQPYAIAGLGFTQYAPDGDFGTLHRFSWALGGGVQVPLTNRLGLRFEGKWDPALMNSSSAVFCNSATGRCVVSASGTLINQFDFTAGLALKI